MARSTRTRQSLYRLLNVFFSYGLGRSGALFRISPFLFECRGFSDRRRRRFPVQRFPAHVSRKNPPLLAGAPHPHPHPFPPPFRQNEHVPPTKNGQHLTMDTRAHPEIQPVDNNGQGILSVVNRYGFPITRYGGRNQCCRFPFILLRRRVRRAIGRDPWPPAARKKHEGQQNQAPSKEDWTEPHLHLHFLFLQKVGPDH